MGSLHFFDVVNGMDIINKMTLMLEIPEEWPEVIIVPFRRSLKSAVTRICVITCLDYNSWRVLSLWVTITNGDFLIELVCV